MTETIGWVSSLILLVTIAKQVHKQWHSGTSEGVSKWLFLGQIAASIGFLTYSIIVFNLVFIVTNALMVVNSLFGLGILFYHKRKEGNSAANGNLATQE
ncbi:MAG: hypothetical protein H7Z37_16615 [Pyrinomonadaceae bacterium]|nr:hypothetical protein [Pyrinomonadaceae bacterium]